MYVWSGTERRQEEAKGGGYAVSDDECNPHKRDAAPSLDLIPAEEFLTREILTGGSRLQPGPPVADLLQHFSFTLFLFLSPFTPFCRYCIYSVILFIAFTFFLARAEV